MVKVRRFVGIGMCAGLVVGILSGCGKTGPAGPAGPLLTGTLSGFVYLVNENGDQPQNRDSIAVAIDGRPGTTYTDSTGKWSIAGLETGTYTITFSKQGYGISKAVQQQFLGVDRTMAIVYLVQPPTFHADSLLPRSVPKGGDSSSIYLTAKLSALDSALTGQYRLLVVLGHDSTQISQLSDTVSSFFINTYFKHGVDSTDIRLTPVNFASEGYQSGDVVWIATYAASAGSETSGYLDVTTDRTVYTCVDSVRSNAIQVTLP
jgi:hypothetical protein